MCTYIQNFVWRYAEWCKREYDLYKDNKMVECNDKFLENFLKPCNYRLGVWRLCLTFFVTTSSFFGNPIFVFRPQNTLLPTVKRLKFKYIRKGISSNHAIVISSDSWLCTKFLWIFLFKNCEQKKNCLS